jgi:hypothetical protein
MTRDTTRHAADGTIDDEEARVEDHQPDAHQPLRLGQRKQRLTQPARVCVCVCVRVRACAVVRVRCQTRVCGGARGLDES